MLEWIKCVCAVDVGVGNAARAGGTAATADEDGRGQRQHDAVHQQSVSRDGIQQRGRPGRGGPC